VPDAVIADIKARERTGVVSLPRLRLGDSVRVTAGPLT
jgi:hypothetical protein